MSSVPGNRRAVGVYSLLLATLTLGAAGLGCGDKEPRLKDTGSVVTPDEDTGYAEADAGDTDGADAGSDIAAPPVATTLETTITNKPVKAGKPLDVKCQLLDQEGEPVELEDEELEYKYVFSPRKKFKQKESGELTPIETGDAQIGCASQALSIVDDTPAELEIGPGPVDTVRTSLSEDKVTADTTVDVTCDAFDAWGNPVPNAMATVQIDAMGSGITVDKKKVTITKADIYQVSCHVNGAKRQVGASLEVTPGLPDSIALAAVPMKMNDVYGLGEVVRFPATVTDEYGNPIRNASIDYSLQPSATNFGRARWEFNAEGVYQITATVQGMTKGGKDLSAQKEIIVNGEGPEITCDSPANGKMLDRDPSRPLKFNGTVNDTHGVSSVTVNGNQITAQNGQFSTGISTRYGINFVDVEATDKYGEQNGRTCAFLIADKWHGENDYMNDSVAMRLEQDALDDKSRRGSIGSLGDILHTVLNSRDLKRTLDQEMMKQNPLKDSCDQSGGILGCLHHSKVEYIRRSGGRPGITSSTNSAELDWVNGGMDVKTKLDNLGVRLKITSTLYDGKGWVKIDHVDVDLTTDIELQNGRPKASLRPGSVTVDVGQIDLQFSGWQGQVVSWVQPVIQSQLQSFAKDQVKNAIKNNVNQVLDSLFSSLDVNSLGSQFDVPQFDGSGTVSVDFNLRFSRLGVSAARALIGIGTKFTTPNIQHTGPSNGVPLPTGNILLDPNTQRDAAVSIHVGILNHVLNALWRGGMFDATIGRSLLGSNAPKGTKADLTLGLPPVAVSKGSGNVELMLGGATLELVYPGLFDQPVDIEVGLVAESGVNLKNGDTLQFQNIKLTEFYFSPQDISLNSQNRQVIEQFLENLFQGVVDQSLNSGLPSLPIPSFTITQTLADFGLPLGKKLGIKQPGLGGTSRHFILEGNFGIR